jgi:membrane-associated phospholipid phosphatase
MSNLLIDPFQLSINPWAILKIVYLFVVLIFLLFAAMVVRQTQLMANTICSSISQKTKFVGYFYQPSAVRPFEILGVAPSAAYLNNAGFPSDHILFAMVIFYAVWFESKNKKIAYLLLGLICLVSIGRVAALVHSPIDIFSGILFASIGCVWYIKPKKLKQ